MASEHHKFYLKLRDSFISLTHIFNELNIPLTANQAELKECDIFPGDYEIAMDKPSNIIADVSIKNIDKATKTTGLRVRNLKKSMLNDNKLIKLRNKFLKRSKSTVTAESIKREESSGHSDDAYVHMEFYTKEECQNKENELPKSNYYLMPSQQQQDDKTFERQEVVPKVMSPNRNRVKMGTRVFSTRFLNKSFENLDLYRMNDCGNCSSDHSEPERTIRYDIESGTIDGKKNSLSGRKNAHRDGADTDVDGISLKSTSLSSLYHSEKLSESPCSSRAYVIRKYTKTNSMS